MAKMKPVDSSVISCKSTLLCNIIDDLTYLCLVFFLFLFCLCYFI